MSDISTDLQTAINAVHAPLPQGRAFGSSEVSAECTLKSTAQAMVHRFRQLRENWYASNRCISELEAKVKALRKLCEERPIIVPSSQHDRHEATEIDLWFSRIDAASRGEGTE